MTIPPGEIDTLYNALYSRLRLFILKRVGDEDAANDIIQDVFLKIHSKLGTLRDGAKLESWVFQITRNAIIDHARARSPERGNELPDIGEDSTDEDLNARIAPYIKELVESLPEPYREALRLTEYEGLTQRELADRAGISLSGAKSRVQRARGMVKDLLFQCCHFEFDKYGTIIDYHPISCCCCTPEGTELGC